jgi:cytoskeletal protein CcmA (bactofilin family)
MRSMRKAWRRRLWLPWAALLLLLFSGTALAAEVAGGEEVYRLERGQVVDDDLYVAAREIYIEGTVQGDLIATAAYVEISGVVEGDVMAAAGGIELSGIVQDDARLAGSGITISGSVNDDLFVAGGGGMPGMAFMPFPFGAPSVTPGVRLESGATVGGDAYVAGGDGMLNGAVGGDLFAAMGSITFGGNVTGDATLYGGSLTVAPEANVTGELRYRSDQEVIVPEGVAGTVTREETDTPAATPERGPASRFFSWLLRTALILVGLALLGWLLASLAPRWVAEPANAIEQRPLEAAIYGFLVAVAAVPVSAALVFVAVLFWGWFPGGIFMLAFLFGLLGVVWVISPVVAGLWLGRKLAPALGLGSRLLPALLTGVVVIALSARVIGAIPCLGQVLSQIIYLLSFALAVGGWIMAQRRQEEIMPAPIVADQPEALPT